MEIQRRGDGQAASVHTQVSRISGVIISLGGTRSTEQRKIIGIDGKNRAQITCTKSKPKNMKRNGNEEKSNKS